MNIFMQQILGSMTGFLIAQLIIYVIEKIEKRKKSDNKRGKTMNKYQKAIETLKNEYDAFLITNKYGRCTHAEEFALLSELEGDHVQNALGWIKNCYDCYYQDELDEDSAFAYLEKLAERKEE